MDEIELLEIIEEAARDGRMVLNLSNEGTVSLLAEIGKLTNLTTLSLYGNQLTSVPAEIGQLSNQKEFDLFDNKLTSIAEALGNLINLKVLWLDIQQVLTGFGRYAKTQRKRYREYLPDSDPDISSQDVVGGLLLGSVFGANILKRCWQKIET